MKILIVLSLIALSAASGAFAHGQQSMQFQEGAPESRCLYQMTVATGSRKDAGTDAKVTLWLEGKNDYLGVWIDDLASWGDMGPNHDYFERGSTETFSGYDHCLHSRPCRMLLKSDNSGNKPGWYVRYVKVTEFRHDGTKWTTEFTVNQWLALDEEPRELSAYRNVCGRVTME